MHKAGRKRLGSAGIVALGAAGGILLANAVRSAVAADDVIVSIAPPDQGRPINDTTAVAVLPINQTRRLLPDTTRGYRGRLPAGITVDYWRGCLFAVSDRWDAAIHLYSTSAGYVGSVEDGPLDESAISQATSVSFTPDGGLLVADRRFGTFARFSPKGTREWVRSVDPPFRGAIFGSEVAVGFDGRIYDHWFANPYSIAPGEWTADLPLIRVFDSTGTAVGGIGSISVEDGTILTPAMNYGRVMVEADTVWFATRAAATIRGFVEGPKQWEVGRVVDLPVFYHMDPPRETYHTDTGRYGRRTDPHIIDIATLPDGGWLVVQAMRYEVMPDGGGLRPHTAIVRYDRDGVLAAIVRPEGEVREVVAHGGYVVFTMLAEVDGGRRRSVWLAPTTIWGVQRQEHRELCATVGEGP